MATATCEGSSRDRQLPSLSWTEYCCWGHGNRSSLSISIPDPEPGNLLSKSWVNDHGETGSRIGGTLAHQPLPRLVDGGVGEAVGWDLRWARRETAYRHDLTRR